MEPQGEARSEGRQSDSPSSSVAAEDFISTPIRIPLGDAINGATRSVHARLNKIVLHRLPLALPPRSDNPSLYITGLLYLAPIYITFECLWRSLLQKPAGSPEACLSSEVAEEFRSERSYFLGHPLRGKERQPVVLERVRSILQNLYIPELQRSDRLKADIRDLTGWSEQAVDEQIRATAKTGHVATFIRHIEQSVEKHPHALLAYAWVLYMALFSGGRFIRATLESAGDRFWRETPSPVRPGMLSCRRHPDSLAGGHTGSLGPATDDKSEIHDPNRATRHRSQTSPREAYPLNFFHFSTARDGEDLKDAFKISIAAADALLTDREREHVVQEADAIFNSILRLASQLDDVCGTDLDADAASDGLAALLGPPMRRQLRDSIAVSKERAYRAAAMAAEGELEQRGPPSLHHSTDAASSEGCERSNSGSSYSSEGTGVSQVSRLSYCTYATGSRTPTPDGPHHVHFGKKRTPPDERGRADQFRGNTDGVADEALGIPNNNHNNKQRLLASGLVPYWRTTTTTTTSPSLLRWGTGLDIAMLAALFLVVVIWFTR